MFYFYELIFFKSNLKSILKKQKSELYIFFKDFFYFFSFSYTIS
ncbi:hypothetical protein FUSPEROL_02541 [Fusobacterium periodonticum ATCC 33693]|uniref:Uncharacterized protein n=1 Tax=Fusobacterium periodonticum ATCC 33693 TaxID=546275 RepID=D4CYM6_9FUSO|nr:hypothetical protein FUSPEROL_02541 [Fusobacterium periodonticum ATCC 33693]